MDCKRVTVIRIGPVISTRMKALHGNVWCFFVLSAVHLTSPFMKKRLSQPAGRDKRFLFYCAPKRILKS